jgi:2-amino-4-hydroxy-6-hydroxymethyldihydropteridine diphosphokinase
MAESIRDPAQSVQVARCYVGLGANLGDGATQLRQAVFELDRRPKLKVIACSSLYASAPLGPEDQPDFLNAVCALDCELEPLALLDLLQALEQRAGRVRTRRWGPRVLDLDLLLYGALRMQSSRLHLPHPELQRRSFVLQPLAELCGTDFRLPDGSTLGSWLVLEPGPALRGRRAFCKDELKGQLVCPHTGTPGA